MLYSIQKISFEVGLLCVGGCYSGRLELEISCAVLRLRFCKHNAFNKRLID